MQPDEDVPNEAEASRRTFLKGMAAAVGAIALTSHASEAFGCLLPASRSLFPVPRPSSWSDQIGLELFTVRDMIAKDYIGTLEKVAAIGYKEIEPAGGYANMPPKQFRAELDRIGLKMPSTHSGISAGPQADVEKELEGFQVMGIEYANFSAAPPSGGRRGGRGRPATPVTPAEQRKQMEQFIKASAQARTVDDVKQEAARYNDYGKMAQKFGIKLLVHNHTVEFIPCKDAADQIPYSILLAETDPALVVFQMDIGWASVAGQNPIQLFQQHPGRFALWHVKDVAGLKCLPPVPEQGARMAEARLVPVGNGEIDYEEIFKQASVAGMKHFAIEQDSAADWGDSIAAARVSYEHLRAMLASQA